MRSIHFLSLCTLVVVATSAFACAAPVEADSVDLAAGPGANLGTAKSALYSIGTIWPTAPDGAHEIPVCFETGLDTRFGTGFNGRTASVANFSTYKDLIREAIEDSWGRVSNIRLVNWGDCPSRNDSLMFGWVTIYWNSSNNTNIGYRTDTWTRMGLTIPDVSSASSRANFQGVVRHEFGHALGFQHEKDRPDNDQVACPSGVSTPGTTYTTNDPLSVMNFTYCPSANARGGSLSPQDIAGVQKAYGPKPRGSLVGLNGRCVDVMNASTAAGAPVIMYDCYGQANDTWSMSTAGPTGFRARYSTVDRFLSAPLPLNAWGTFLTSEASPALTFSQQWSLDGLWWRGYGGMCVSYDLSPYPANNAHLRMVECSSNSPRWDFLADHRIRLAGTNYCANVLGGGTATGTYVGLWPCSATPAPNEQFQQTPLGELSYSNKCLNVWGGEAVTGAEVRLWSCGGPELNSRFYATGKLKTAGQCMDVYGGVSENYSYVDAYPCQVGAKNQEWDVYW